MIILKKKNIAKAAELLKKGQTLVFPTETSYGLGCDATNQEAVDKIFKIKQRDPNKSLLIVVPSIEMAKKYIKWDKQIEEIANKYWPGSLTVVQTVLDNTNLASGVISKNNTVAVRITNYNVLISLSLYLNKPIVATSANVSRTDKVYNGGSKPEEVFYDINTQPDAVLDFGQLPQTLPTTLVDISGGEIKILRQGELKV